MLHPCRMLRRDIHFPGGPRCASSLVFFSAVSCFVRVMQVPDAGPSSASRRCLPWTSSFRECCLCSTPGLSFILLTSLEVWHLLVACASGSRASSLSPPWFSTARGQLLTLALGLCLLLSRYGGACSSLALLALGPLLSLLLDSLRLAGSCRPLSLVLAPDLWSFPLLLFAFLPLPAHGVLLLSLGFALGLLGHLLRFAFFL